MPYRDKEARRAYQKQYWSRPEVKARNVQSRLKYRQSAKYEQWVRAHNTSPSYLEQRRAYNRTHYIENKDQYRQKARESRARTKLENGWRYQRELQCRREWYTKQVSVYGRNAFGRDRFRTARHLYLLVQQGGLCKLCGRVITFCGSEIDHDHETDVVRGLLCRSCNQYIGHYEKLRRVLGNGFESPVIETYLEERTPLNWHFHDYSSNQKNGGVYSQRPRSK